MERFEEVFRNRIYSFIMLITASFLSYLLYEPMLSFWVAVTSTSWPDKAPFVLIWIPVVCYLVLVFFWVSLFGLIRGKKLREQTKYTCGVLILIKTLPIFPLVVFVGVFLWGFNVVGSLTALIAMVGMLFPVATLAEFGIDDFRIKNFFSRASAR